MQRLLRDRSFAYLTGTQFLTVFNDNAFKQVVLLLALGSTGLGADPQALAGFVFALPFLLFAVTAGDLADRFPKRTMVLAAKWAEVAVMLLAAGALYLRSLPLVLAVLFCMGAQSAFLGPAKYGLLPEIFRDARLARANAFFQMTVLLSIILGTAVAGDLKQALGERLWVAGLVFALIALAGVGLAARIERLPAADPRRRIRFQVFARLAESLRQSARIPGLLPAMLGHGVYWMVGGVVLFAWNEMGQRILGVNEGDWTRGLALIQVSIAGGCLLAGRLSRKRLRLDLVPGCALLMALSFLAVAAGPRDPLYVLLMVFTGSFFSGMYLIPLRTLVQTLPASADKGRALGSSQMIDWTFILGASGLKAGLHAAGVDAAQTFYALALVMAGAGLALRPLARRAPGSGRGSASGS